MRIAFLLTALNDLDIFAADSSNAYLNTPCHKKVYFIAEAEFGPSNKGKIVIIVRALYGLKSSSAAWHAYFTESLDSKENRLGFTPCGRVDPDVWRKPQVNKKGEHY